jgi:type II secretory pathway component PulK
MRRSERGSVLLVVVVLATAAIAVSAALIERASLVAVELHARREVLCSRYAALGGLALGAPTAADGSAAALIDPRVNSLVVSRVRLSPSWCVLRATASCDGATRTLDRTLADASVCSSPSP